MAIDPSMSSGAGRYARAQHHERENVRVKPRAPHAAPNAVPVDDADRRMTRMVAVARFLDSAFVVPGLGIRLGWDAVIGLATGVGDAAGALASLYIVYEARRLGAPRKVLLMMLGNVAIDTVIGAIPALGDIVDAAFKANLRNLKLLGVTMHDEGHTWDRPAWVRNPE